ncbi:MAG: lipoprotein-releasing ABC transporter permease subunit, partial [Pseudomonadota bacterium]
KRSEGFVSLITAFSLAGIALGVAALIVITSVMNGVKTEMLKHFIGLSGHISVYSHSRSIDNYDEIIKQIKSMPQVQNAVAAIEGQAMVSARSQASGSQIIAFNHQDLMNNPDITTKITAGNLDDLKNGDGVAIGQRMAENLGVSIGDYITLISPEGRQTIAGMVPRIKEYKVAAIFKLGMNSYDAGLIIMNFADAGIYFKLNDGGHNSVSSIQVRVNNPDDAEKIAKDISLATADNLRIYDWKASNKSVFEALNVQRNVMFIILTLIIIVAAFNIVSTLIMLVKDKGRDIAILRTQGASRASVMRIFFACGAIIGIAGTFIGVVSGLILAINIDNIRAWVEKISGGKILAEQFYFLATLPAEVNPREVTAIIIMSLTLSFVATIYPARRAARLDPAEALRYE